MISGLKVSLCCVRCAQYHPPFLLGGQLSVPDFEKGDQKKNESVEGLGLVLKSSCHRYLPGGLTMFLVKKDFVKWI